MAASAVLTACSGALAAGGWAAGNL